MKPLRLLAAAIVLTAGAGLSPVLAADPPTGQQLSNGCTACHGVEGRGGSAVPALAGDPVDDLVAKLHAFRDQKGDATIMNRIARGFTDDEIQALATYFSSIK
jgi:sulfide dehydrogenase cytochrome subunit